MLCSLLFCLIAQIQPTVQDMEFDRIQIEWIASTKTVTNLEHVLPQNHAFLIRSLGCEHYGCRVLAREELSRLKFEAFDALVWGTRVNDFEISSASLLLLNQLYICPHCDGSGEVSVPDMPQIPDGDDWDDGGPVNRTCLHCTGTGDTRYIFSYNGPFADEKIIPAVIFPRLK